MRPPLRSNSTPDVHSWPSSQARTVLSLCAQHKSAVCLRVILRIERMRACALQVSMLTMVNVYASRAGSITQTMTALRRHVHGRAIHVPLHELLDNCRHQAHHQDVYVLDSGDMRSREACLILEAASLANATLVHQPVDAGTDGNADTGSASAWDAILECSLEEAARLFMTGFAHMIDVRTAAEVKSQCAPLTDHSPCLSCCSRLIMIKAGSGALLRVAATHTSAHTGPRR